MGICSVYSFEVPSSRDSLGFRFSERYLYGFRVGLVGLSTGECRERGLGGSRARVLGKSVCCCFEPTLGGSGRWGMLALVILTSLLLFALLYATPTGG
mgnify:CR=1 FL=1